MFGIVHVGIDTALEHNATKTSASLHLHSCSTTHLKYQCEVFRIRVGLAQRLAHQHVQEATRDWHQYLVHIMAADGPRVGTDVGVRPI